MSVQPGAVPDEVRLPLGIRVVFKEVAEIKLEQVMGESTSVTERVTEREVSSVVD